MAETTTTDTTKTDPPPAPKPADDVQALKGELEALRKEKAEWASKQVSLNDKVKSERDAHDMKLNEQKVIESALKFNLTSDQFIKANENILPSDVPAIFKMAETEKYDSPIQKANATKAAVIQSFFSQQANVDFLTDSQKIILDDYLKLTKNGKEEKAQALYDNLFEPALNSLRRVKKAEEVARAKSGLSQNTSAEQVYKDKLAKMAEKKFFRGKN